MWQGLEAATTTGTVAAAASTVHRAAAESDIIPQKHPVWIGSDGDNGATVT